LEAQAADDRERELNAAIDWHEFAVAGEIEFDDDDVSELPPLVTVSQLRALARLTTADSSVTQAAGAGDAAGAGGDEQGDDDMDMDMDMEPLPSADIDASKIRSNFRRDDGEQLSRAARVQVCPRCGQEIPVEEMAEHMRIELLDPKYRQQRAVNEAKTAERSFVGSSEVAANLARLAKKRTDIFGAADDHLTAHANASTATPAATGSALDQQLEEIKRQTQLPSATQQGADHHAVCCCCFVFLKKIVS